MLTRLRQLEKLSKVLEADNEQRITLIKPVEKYINDFLNSENLNIFQADNISTEIYKTLSIKERPSNMEYVIKLLKEHIIKPGLNITSPGFLGYVPGSGLYASALGDYIAAITNRFAGAFYVSPGAARLENILIRWMSHIVGYSRNAGGNLSSGGSLANLIGIVTARQAFNLKSKDFSRLVVYLSSQVHHSVIKALRITGLQEVIIRYIPVDQKFRLRSDFLQKTILQDQKKKLLPWLIIATVGTTNTGSIDPISEISQLALKNKLWLHVDAAYGGFFILCRNKKKLFQDINKADSITIDPHKGLFIPYGLGAILTKEQDLLLKAHYYDEIDYLPSMNYLYDEVSSAALSPELSKHFRGLRMWLPLKLYGLAPFRAALQEKLLLAEYFYKHLLKIKNIEIACKPELSIVTFRYCPDKGDANLFNEQLAETIKKESQIFFSTTYLENKLYLRMACLNFKTHLETMELALDILEHFIKRLLQE